MQSCGSLDDVALRKFIGPNRTSEVRVVWLLIFASLNCISLFLAYISLSTTSEILFGSNILSKALRFARARALSPSPPPLSPPRPAISTFNVFNVFNICNSCKFLVWNPPAYFRYPLEHRIWLQLSTASATPKYVHFVTMIAARLPEPRQFIRNLETWLFTARSN